MIDTGTAIVAGSVISLFGFIIMLELNTHNWFKKENWKMKKTNIMNENRIKLKKLEKDLGVNAKIQTNTGSSGLGEIIGDVIKNYAAGSQDTSSEGLGGVISNFLNDNPEIVNGFLKGLTNKSEGSETSQSQQAIFEG